MSEELARIRAETEHARALIARGKVAELPTDFRPISAAPWDFSLPTATLDATVRVGEEAPSSGWFRTGHASAYPGEDPPIEGFGTEYVTPFKSGSPAAASAAAWNHIDGADSFPIDRRFFEAIFGAGFVVAGGSVCDMLTGALFAPDRFAPIEQLYGSNEVSNNDFDLFAPGMCPEEAEAKFFDLMPRLAKLYSTETCAVFPVIYRTINCITALLKIDGGDNCIELQLITRKYTSVAEVIYSFDLAPSAVAWDGQNIWMTSAAVYAHRVGVFELDLSKRRRSFEDRIVKYVSRKRFGVVLPNLKIEFSSYRYIGLPHLGLSVNDVYGNNIMLSQRGISAPSRYRSVTLHDLEEDRRVYGALPYLSSQDLAEHNIRRLLKGDTYLVWHLSDDNSWNLVFTDVDEVIRTLSLLIHGSDANPLKCMKQIIGEDPTELGVAVLWRMQRKKISKDDAVYPLLTRKAEELRAIADTHINKSFRWKEAEQGTDLDVRAAAADRNTQEDHAADEAAHAADEAYKTPCDHMDELVFKMERISARDWYGDFYKEN